MSNLFVGIADYGVGNVGSVSNLIKSLGHSVVHLSSIKDIRDIDVLVLPGVGSAKVVSTRFSEDLLRPEILGHIESGKKTVGLCLGAQLLFDYLKESETKGLEVLRGEVLPIDSSGWVNTGWRVLNWEELRDLNIGRGIRPTDTFFFNHEFAIVPSDETIQICHAIEPRVAAIVKRDNIWAIQFHPEKSQKAGRLLMRNVLRHD
jgi:glutamine amidotransferase